MYYIHTYICVCTVYTVYIDVDVLCPEEGTVRLIQAGKRSYLIKNLTCFQCEA